MILSVVHQTSEFLVKKMYDLDDGNSININNTVSRTIEIQWKLFHANPRGIQVRAAMEFTIHIAAFMKPYTTEPTLLNIFNYLRLHNECDDHQVVLLCSEYRNRLTVIHNKIIKQLKCNIYIYAE